MRIIMEISDVQLIFMKIPDTPEVLFLVRKLLEIIP